MSRILYTTFNAAGELLKQVNVDEPSYNGLKDVLPPHVLGHYSYNEFYVSNGAVESRPSQQTQLAASKLIGLPVPCTIRINQTIYECDEPDCSLFFAYPGDYTITIQAFPFQDWSVEMKHEN